jgi:hypothetical protein
MNTDGVSLRREWLEHLELSEMKLQVDEKNYTEEVQNVYSSPNVTSFIRSQALIVQDVPLASLLGVS